MVLLKKVKKALLKEGGATIEGFKLTKSDLDTLELFLEMYLGGQSIDGYRFYGDVKTLLVKYGAYKG